MRLVLVPDPVVQLFMRATQVAVPVATLVSSDLEQMSADKNSVAELRVACTSPASQEAGVPVVGCVVALKKAFNRRPNRSAITNER